LLLTQRLTVMSTPSSSDKDIAHEISVMDMRLDHISNNRMVNSPYVLTVPSDRPFRVNDYLAEAWIRGTPFSLDEAELQYVTFFGDWGDSLLKPVGPINGSRGGLPTPGHEPSGRSATSTPKVAPKKITLGEYKRKTAAGPTSEPKAQIPVSPKPEAKPEVKPEAKPEDKAEEKRTPMLKIKRSIEEVDHGGPLQKTAIVATQQPPEKKARISIPSKPAEEIKSPAQLIKSSKPLALPPAIKKQSLLPPPLSPTLPIALWGALNEYKRQRRTATPHLLILRFGKKTKAFEPQCSNGSRNTGSDFKSTAPPVKDRPKDSGTTSALARITAKIASNAEGEVAKLLRIPKDDTISAYQRIRRRSRKLAAELRESSQTILEHDPRVEIMRYREAMVVNLEGVLTQMFSELMEDQLLHLGGNLNGCKKSWIAVGGSCAQGALKFALGGNGGDLALSAFAVGLKGVCYGTAAEWLRDGGNEKEAALYRTQGEECVDLAKSYLSIGEFSRWCKECVGGVEADDLTSRLITAKDVLQLPYQFFPSNCAEAVRFGLKFLREYCRKNDVKWEEKLAALIREGSH